MSNIPTISYSDINADIAETTAKLTDLSISDIVIDMFIVCRHVIISKRAVSY